MHPIVPFDLWWKRSYKRALKRVGIHGWTWYKGRILSGPRSASKPDPMVMPQNQKPPSSHRRHRLSLFNWNCGGLPVASWDYFLHWITQQQLDIILFQETHWGYSSDWLLKDYFCIHSGVASGKAGLLIMISRKLCHQHDRHGLRLILDEFFMFASMAIIRTSTLLMSTNMFTNLLE